MSCKSCGTPPPETIKLPADMEFTAHRNTIRLTDGTLSTIHRSFINPLTQPSGGWTFSFILNSVQHNIPKKRRPQEVAAAVAAIFQSNGKPLSTIDLWLNLNLFWFDRVDPIHWLVSKDELLSVAAPNGNAESVPMTTNTPPQIWGSRAWQFMALYLAGTNYSATEFLAICRTVLDLLNPALNPNIGCQDCYLEFSRAYGNLTISPPKNRTDARQWLWAFHNSVNARIGKPEITFDTAVRLNYWKA